MKGHEAPGKSPSYLTITLWKTPKGEILYHWHPQGTSTVNFPHVHLRPGGQLGGTRINEAHFPTGLVALEEVLRLAIREFGVRPRRPDWAEVLDSTQAAYEDWRTWA